jgi:lipid II:glycine glycyltransferase (peptidoglycan interpeptide bridge formation enzyme)
MSVDRIDNHDGESWNAALTEIGGNILQSWEWGDFKQRHGWIPERMTVEGDGGKAMAQILFRKRGPFSIAYLPRGPVAKDDLALGLLDAIDKVCARNRAIVLFAEPDRPLPETWLRQPKAFHRGPPSFQTSRTVKVELLDDDTLLTRMRKDTRYNINYARRNGVEIEEGEANQANLDRFHRLLQETSERGGFGIHARSYYEDFLDQFGRAAILLFARSGRQATAGLIAARFGREARSMYAGSTRTHGGRGDAALLRFAAMQWARDHGCTHYDMGGIAGQSGAVSPDPGGMPGVDTFKTGFGGEIVTYPETMERRYRPAIAWAMRRLNARFRPAPEHLPDSRSGKDWAGLGITPA